ncbi:MAG: hypothetical protein MZU84_03775 [Sphingobacterium sp.]|nr:hypothetical protein [Sphingobacterium sp.]
MYQPENSEKIQLPLEDISAIIMETRQAVITSHLLSEIAEYGIALFSYDEKHLPSGLFASFHQHCKFSEIAWFQAEWSEPFKKDVANCCSTKN